MSEPRQRQARPARERTRHLVLVGGGHAHVQVLRALGQSHPPGLELTLVARDVEAPYSGMLPGFVAGHYDRKTFHIDLERLARFAGARLVHDSAVGVDRSERRLLCADGPPIGYDLLSIDVGITPELGAIAGAAEHAIPVKPIARFTDRWQALERAALQPDGPRRLCVVGGGAAGFELVLAARHRLCGLSDRPFEFTLVAGADLLARPGGLARWLGRRALRRAGIALIEGERAVEVGAGFLRLESGRRLAADAALVSTAARPPDWFATTDLPRDEGGFLALRPSLQLLDDDRIFAAGDCAGVVEHPRPKAGVFAVRQGPVLADNLRRVLAGAPARPFHPQRSFLVLLSLGGRRAIAARNGLALEGAWVWRWKDRIDRRFMRQFEVPQGGERS